MKAKIALIGAGNIGGTLGLLAAQRGFGDITVIDVVEGVPQGKSLDLGQAGATQGYDSTFTPSQDMSSLKGADVILITAGVPRKPGMSRDDLLQINGGIIKSVAENIKTYAPDAFVVMITNPLDAMVWLLREVSGLPAERVVGMAGVLDTSRFRKFLADALGVSMEAIQAMVLGGHGDTMVPILRYTSVAGIPLGDVIKMGWISQEKVDGIVERTRQGGGEIVAHLKTGSAFYAPAASAMSMVEAYLQDRKALLPCAAYLTGQYGLKDLYVGVPVIIGARGVERVVELDLTAAERSAFEASAREVQKLIDAMRALKII